MIEILLGIADFTSRLTAVNMGCERLQGPRLANEPIFSPAQLHKNLKTIQINELFILFHIYLFTSLYLSTEFKEDLIK